VPIVNIGSINIHYETAGDGDPVLLIMGLAMPGAVWIPMLPLMTGFKCIYFDNRGTGQSDKPPGPYTVPDMADDVSGLLKVLGIARAKVYGVSMGGMIAQELALRHPEQVERLVLGCTLAGGPTAKVAAPETLEKLMLGSGMMALNPDKGLDTILPILFPQDFIAAHPEMKAILFAGLASTPRTPPETVLNQIAGIAQFNAYDRLAQIKCPVLIVHGDKDLLVPYENAAIIKSRIPQAEVLTVPGAGHVYQAADPVGIHQRIVSFLRS
jgi:pimeloyl-ACP methyl ester carboxylesterase